MKIFKGFKSKGNDLLIKGSIVGTSLLALPVMTMAAESSPSTLGTEMVTQFTSLAAEGKVVLMAIVGLGLGIFGLKWVFSTGKTFFGKATK